MIAKTPTPPTELKFIERTLQFVDVHFIEVASKVQACFSGNMGRNVEIILLLTEDVRLIWDSLTTGCPLNTSLC